MLQSLIKDKSFYSLSKEFKQLSHAYLFYSKDSVLNNDIASLFAMSIFCGNFPPCLQCEACKRTMLSKNPDLVVLDKPNIVVEDITKILDSADLKPMIHKNKIILIRNVENMNEIAQNKLLKTLEEPNASLKFILTTTNEEKLLPTIRSRLKKIYLALDNIDNVKDELLQNGVKVEFINSSFSLEEMIDNSNNKDYMSFLNNIQNSFLELKTTQEIPRIVANLKLSSANKFIYLNLLSKIFDINLQNTTIFSSEIVNLVKSEYSMLLIEKVKQLIEDAFKKLKSNVNANYVYDNLFYKILKEKYLCKQ